MEKSRIRAIEDKLSTSLKSLLNNSKKWATKKAVLALTIGSFIYPGCSPSDDFTPYTEPSNGIQNVEVVPAKMDLAAIVSFETSRESYPSVKFCSEDNDCLSTFTNYDSSETEHEVLVIGMKPDSDYSITAVAEDEDGNQVSSDQQTFHTGSLPYELDLDFNWDVYNPNQTDSDWILASLCWSDYVTPIIPVIFNSEGAPIAYFSPWPDKEGTADYQTSWYDDKILIGGSIPQNERPILLDLSGEIVWEGAFKQPQSIYGEGWMHHTFHPTENGNIIMTAMAGQEFSDTDKIIEFNLDLAKKSSEDDAWTLDDIVAISEWSWNGSDFFNTDELGTFGNASYVAGNEVGYYSREFNILNAIDRSSKEVLWQFGELEREQNPVYGDFEEPEGGFPTAAHGAKKTPDGTYLFYDNGYLSDDIENHHVRLTEYRLNTEEKTGEIIFQYPNDEDQDNWWVSGIGGDIKPLDNGNFLVATGLDLEPYPHRIFELTKDGTINWELKINGGHERGVYTAEKIPAQAYHLEE
ncbi:MAG: aryl-sulfate sulfotransferase [archaeon]